MVTDRAIQEMVAAFAAGCMDKDNFVQFKDYMNQGGDLPRSELGELQNIISMIPIILELENPDPAIKDMIAKKLIGMKDEIKTKIIADKKRTSAGFTKVESPSNTFGSGQTEMTIGDETFPKPEEEKKFKRDLAATFAAEEPLAESLKVKKVTKRFERVMTAEEPHSIFAEPKRETVTPLPIPPPLTSASAASAPEKMTAGITGWIAILLTLILFMIGGYFGYSSIHSLQKQVSDLNSQVVLLKGQINSANNFVSNYTSFIRFFNYKDVLVINLTPKEQADKGSAQLFLSFSSKQGLLQFNDAKPLEQNQTYQLWSMSRGQVTSMGVYQPLGYEFLRITDFPSLPKENIDGYMITIEPKAGSPSPSSNVYLTAVPNGVPPKGKMR